MQSAGFVHAPKVLVSRSQRSICIVEEMIVTRWSVLAVDTNIILHVADYLGTDLWTHK